MTWEYHVSDSAKGIYAMILGGDILTELGLNLNTSKYIIKEGDRHLKGRTTHMIDLGTYTIKDLHIINFSPDEPFMN